MKYYLIDLNDKQVGPYSYGEIEQLKITPKTLVREAHSEAWKQAGQINTLSHLFSSSTVPQQNNNYKKRSSYYYQPIYEAGFDHYQLTNEELDRFKSHTFTESFPVAVAILLHFITLGFFTTVFCGIKYSSLPNLHHEDSDTGKAIGFLFIPFFNFYWLFVFWRQLVKRINFQFKLRDLAQPISLDLATVYCILCFVPYLGMFVNLFIIGPILLSQIQNATNALVEEQYYNTHSN